MASIRELAIAKLREIEAGQEPGQMAGQEVSHIPPGVQPLRDSSNPQKTAKNDQVSHCPTPIGTGRRDSTPQSGTAGGTKTGTVGTRIATARLREWCGHVNAIDYREPRNGFSAMRWVRMVDTSVWWLENFGRQAALDGWSTADVFGVHPSREGYGGLIDRLGNARGLVMDCDRAKWRDVYGVPDSFNRGAYPGLQPFWEIQL